MQLAVAPFMGNFSVSALCTGPKRRSVHMHVKKVKQSRYRPRVTQRVPGS
jgi:hypothetical protein